MQEVNSRHIMSVQEIQCRIFLNIKSLNNIALIREVCQSWKLTIDRNYNTLMQSQRLLIKTYKDLVASASQSEWLLLQIKSIDPNLNYSQFDFKDCDEAKKTPLILTIYKIKLAIARNDASCITEIYSSKHEHQIVLNFNRCLSLKDHYLADYAAFLAIGGKILDANSVATLITYQDCRAQALCAIADKDPDGLMPAKSAVKILEESELKLKLLKKLFKQGAYPDHSAIKNTLQSEEGHQRIRYHIRIIDLAYLEEKPDFQATKEKIDSGHEANCALAYLVDKEVAHNYERALETALAIPDPCYKAKAIISILRHVPSLELCELAEDACSKVEGSVRLTLTVKLAKVLREIAHIINPLSPKSQEL